MPAVSRGDKATIENALREGWSVAKISKDDWPSHSPDLAPMDNSVWGWLVDKVYAAPVNSVQVLRRRIQNAWNQLPQRILNRIIDQFVPRIQEMEAAQGGHIVNFIV